MLTELQLKIALNAAWERFKQTKEYDQISLDRVAHVPKDFITALTPLLVQEIKVLSPETFS